MRLRLRLAAATAAVLGGAAGAAAVLHAGDMVYSPPATAERLLYVTSGATARRVMLSFDALAADVYWIRSIQHYGRDRRSTRTTDRFALLQPLLQMTTTLDPKFAIAYRVGAILLAEPFPNGPGRPDEAIALLQKGLAATPDRWQYAEDIGFIHYVDTYDYRQAAEWFDRATAMSGAPDWLKPLAAITRAQGGDRQGARLLLESLATSEEGWLRQSAERGLAQLEALDRMDTLQAAVDQYYATHGSAPASWQDLVRADLLRSVPVDPTGQPFALDLARKRVILSARSSLNPLPELRNRQ